MFASLSISPRFSIFRSLPFTLAVLVNASLALAAPVCRPDVVFRDVNFSPINLETMQRTWTASLSVDASSCATTSGRFEILFTLWSETAFDDEFVHTFTWTPGLINVAVDVMAHEAIGSYRLHAVAPCPCRQ